MNREQLVEKVRQLGVALLEDEIWEVLDVLLPQVITVEDFRNVPEGSMLIFEDARGIPWSAIWRKGKLHLGDVGYNTDKAIEFYGPLTVVWKP